MASAFTERELDYLREGPRLARLATVGPDGAPHVVPVGWRLNSADDSVEIRGVDLAGTKKYRDVASTGRAAIVIDDVRPPWNPRGIEIRGQAEALAGSPPVIRITPTRIVSWGIESTALGDRHARTVSR